MSSVVPSTLATFPTCPGYGFAAQPQYLVNINPRQGGFERIDRRWTRPLSTYTALSIGERDEAEIQAILNFWHAMHGRATIFLLKDWADFKSCKVNETATATDQPLVFNVDLGAYQMYKEYTVGSLTQERPITQPVGSTILVHGGDNADHTDFTVDENTGLITPDSGWIPVAWGGEFNVPVRFDSELSISVAEKQIQSVDFSLREKLIKLTVEATGSP